jgi:ABC-type nitrate/sulfonate/bicarbonate transport system substrate-binding protein
MAQDKSGPLEKRDLKIGFIPITCATPIIMAEPMGFYRRHGLKVQVVKLEKKGEPGVLTIDAKFLHYKEY